MWYFEKLSRAKWSYIQRRNFLKLLKHLYLPFMLFTCPKTKTLLNLKESKVQERSRKPLKYTNWNKRSTQMVTRASVFTRLSMMRSSFMCNSMEARNIWFLSTKKVATITINVQNVIDFIKKVKSGYVAQCAKTGTTKNVSTNDDCFIFFKNFTWCSMYFRSTWTIFNSWFYSIIDYSNRIYNSLVVYNLWKQFANFFFNLLILCRTEKVNNA